MFPFDDLKAINLFFGPIQRTLLMNHDDLLHRFKYNIVELSVVRSNDL
jgi:hypothetical protein